MKRETEIRVTGYATVSNEELNADYARRRYEDDVLFFVMAIPVLVLLAAWLAIACRPKRY